MQARSVAARDAAPFFPPRSWSRADWLVLMALTVLSILMLGTGLSIRSLWGPEGRWGMIAKEMLQSGNYFVPTVNGIVDFDKPLLSYWAILPFAWTMGLKESAVRMPSVLAGIGTILITFGIGRRLFGWRAGALAGLLLLTTAMFVSWARTASADLLNLFAIWAMFWCFLAGGGEGKLKYLVLLYGIGGLASFLKGPVALAVSLFTLLLYSSTSVLLEVKNLAASGAVTRREALERALFSQFRWLASRQALVGIIAGAALFSVFLLLPVFITGSWVSAQLMWRENVIRFVHPFDHHEPTYIYIKHLLLYSAPWTFLIAASLWEMRRWEAGQTTRWLTAMAVGIFLFFLLSASRRSYYILPILPALALIVGRVLSDALGASGNGVRWAIRAASFATSGLVLIAGLAMVGIYATLADYRHISALAVAVCAIGGGCSALWLVARRSLRKGLIVALSLVFVIELWTFNTGMKLAERQRTLPGCCTELAAYLSGVEDSRIALFRESATLLFYVNRRNLRELDSIQDLKGFEAEHPDGFVIADLNELKAPGDIEYVSGLTILLEQERDSKAGTPRFALLRLGPKEAPSTAVVQQVPARKTTDKNGSGWGAALAAGTPHAR